MKKCYLKAILVASNMNQPEMDTPDYVKVC